MALVAYEFSDESDNESKDNENTNEKISLTKRITQIQNNDTKDLENDVEEVIEIKKLYSFGKDEVSDDEEEDNVPVSFSHLPSPNYHIFNIDESKIKNSKLSSLKKLWHTSSESKSSKELKKKNLVFSKESSGLLALLPNPLEHSSLAPSQLSGSSDSQKQLVPSSLKNSNTNNKTEKVKSKTSIKANDEDEEIGVDFFSLSKIDQIEECDPISIDVLNKEINNLSNHSKVDRPYNVNKLNEPENNERSVIMKLIDHTADRIENNDISNNQERDLDLDEDAIQKLCGRKRTAQNADEIQFIDIREDKILAESKKLLAKHLTDEVTYRPSRTKFGGPSSLGKRKHQITYLAYQAKERELELKNQWSNNRYTKKQTQSKYGF